MDILNFISWIAGKKRVVTSVPDDSLIPVGVRNPQRGDSYTTVGIKKSDLIPVNDCPVKLDFKEGSIGPKVSFRKKTGDNPTVVKDVIIPGELEITRGNNGGGIYNIAIENNFNSNVSPENTKWSTKYTNPALDGWAPIWDVTGRNYTQWRKAIQTPTGDYEPPQYVGMPVVMQYDNGSGAIRYWLVIFTEWGVGGYDEYNFAYDRWEILQPVDYKRNDYTDTVDVLSPGVHIARKDNGGQIYNAVNEPYAEVGVSPRNTRWNSVYTDSRNNYSGFTDLSNLESRVYTDFVAALDGSVGNNVLNTDLIMHDLTTDLYYTVTFKEWTSGGNGGGFRYIRQVIPQSCNVKFADGTVLNTAPNSKAADACCSIDAENNYIVADNSENTVSVGPGGTHDIPDFSGMLIVNDHYDGGVETWIAGGGDTICLGATNTGGGPVGSSLSISGSGYTWSNDSNMVGPFTFTVIKTRNQA